MLLLLQPGAIEGLSPTSLAAFRLYLILLVPCMASVVVGYDISIMNYINGMEPYLSYFGLEGQGGGGGVGTTTALIFAMVSHLPGLVPDMNNESGPLCDRLGRRGGMVIPHSNIIRLPLMVSSSLEVSSYLKAGRFLLGVSTALLQVAGSLYCCEISPPQWRGRLTGIYAAFAILSTIVSGAVANATGRLTTSASWRIPFSLQIIPAAIVLFFVYFIPESPRWMMSVGRKDEARKILIRYHGNGNDNAPLVVLEYREFEESIKLDASSKPWQVPWDYVDLFKTRSDRYRTSIVLLLALCAQWSGSGLSSFLVVLLANDHISTQNLRLILTLISSIVSAIGALCGALILDKVGRRTLWFWGNLCCTIALIISGACTAKFSADSNNLAGSNTAIAFLFLFTFCFCVTYVPLPALYASECMSFDNRANGVALYTFVSSTASLVNTYATPIALADIGWKVYYVFIAWDVFACVLIWFFAVETSGRTLSVTPTFPSYRANSCAGRS
ncbi:general substrate transporter [Mycena olivaceomarginata]|nr:general substrate transporter [Mycena olivaceomarginata]